jgi:transposase
MLADEIDVCIGVDTHRDRHALAVLEARTGGLLYDTQIPADAPGYARALTLVSERFPVPRAWAVEGTGAYGAGLARSLLGQGERVIEIDRPERRGERTRAKSDALDAARAARTALGRSQQASPRAGGIREGLRVLVVTRAGAVEVRRRAILQLRALIVSAPEELRSRLRRLSGLTLLTRCLTLRSPRGADPALRSTISALKSLARRALAATDEAKQLERDIAGHVRALCPQLLAEPGVGPISAAQLLISYSHAGRWPDESAFAQLAGVAPIPASSGRVVRHRLNRGGDRRLNQALHIIILVRRQRDERTRAYIERRIGEGKSAREAVRCLKRYLARHLYRMLEAARLPA